MNREQILEKYRATRALTIDLCRPLRAEDYRIQSMPDVSPPWWNLGHTTWFFAKNILEPFGGYTAEDARYEYVMNSYYESLGPRIRRDHRGLVTRPTNDDVYAFRASVDRRVEELIRTVSEGDDLDRVRFLVTTGCHHEQQHQELLVTEIKHILGSNVPELREPYRPVDPIEARVDPNESGWIAFAGGLYEFGNLEGGWCWDNEMPVHKAWLEGFELGDRLVTNREYLDFMEDGGYSNPLLWLSNGWSKVQDQGWTAPLYWERTENTWRMWTLSGDRDVDPAEPICHVSFYEAEAYARWKGARLPTEREWEHAARTAGFPGPNANFLDSGALHPRPASTGSPENTLLQMGGDLWEWTTSHYEPYPGYKPFEGALMEYNGKFMDNVRVLRGGSCATPADHIRASYRNFWAGETRFQLTGIRLAR